MAVVITNLLAVKADDLGASIAGVEKAACSRSVQPLCTKTHEKVSKISPMIFDTVFFGTGIEDGAQQPGSQTRQ